MVMKAYLEAGQFVTTHGVLGELKLYPWADGPEFIACLPRLYISPQGGAPLELERVRAHKGMCIVKLRGVDGMDAARAYIGKTAYFARADAKLPPGRYFVQDIIGCEVRDAATGAGEAAEAADGVATETEGAAAPAPSGPWVYVNGSAAPHACVSAVRTASCTSGFCTALKANEFSAGNSMTRRPLSAR